MKRVTLDLSNNMEKELEILSRVSGLPKGEVIRVAVSILRLHVEAASEGRKITLAANDTNPAERFKLPFELKEPYTTELGAPQLQTKLKWWQRLLSALRLQ